MPSTWNLGPRCEKGKLGPVEEALNCSRNAFICGFVYFFCTDCIIVKRANYSLLLNRLLQ